jgi:hypothetical protein
MVWTVPANWTTGSTKFTTFLTRRLSQKWNYEDHFHQAEVLLQALADEGTKA